MLRGELITLSEEEHVLIVTLHHIASDAWSRSVIVGEFMALYEAFEQKRTAVLPTLEVQYADYAIWQRSYLEGEVLERKLGYWKEKLESVSPLQLPTDKPRPAVQTSRGAMRSFVIDKSKAEALHAISQQEGTTLFMTMLAAFKVLLYRYSGQTDICVGTPVAGRHQQEVENLIGFFINTLALRTEIDPTQNFQQLLHEVRQSTLEAYEHQEVPFEKVVETVVKDRDFSRPPIFQAMLLVNNAPEIPSINLNDITIHGEGAVHDSSKFELTLSVTDLKDTLVAGFEYNTDLFSEEAIGRMTKHFIMLIEAITTSPTQTIDELNIVSADETRKLLETFNDTAATYAVNETLVNLFEKQVGVRPNAIALVHEDKKLSYKELNERANQLAHFLISIGVMPGDVIPVCISRRFEMATGMLAILKAGAAYVPVDPEYPHERITYMFNDAGSKIAVSTTASRKNIQTKGTVRIVNLDVSAAEIRNKRRRIQVLK